MFTKRIKFFSQGKFHTKSIAELSKNQKILICSLIRPWELISFQYVKFLHELQKELKKYKIEIILITSQAIQIANLDAYDNLNYFKESKCILDKNLEIYDFLSKKFQKKQNLKWLGMNWLFHILIENNKILFFEEQPTENMKKQMKDHIGKELIQEIPKHLRTETLVNLRRCLSIPEDLLYDQPCLFEFKGKVNNRWAYNEDLDRLLYYYKLWPNRKLNKFLQK